MMPRIGRLRIVRSWAGLIDMSMDGSPIIDHTPIEGLYLKRRLELRRLQSDACVRLLPRAPDRRATSRIRSPRPYRA